MKEIEIIVNTHGEINVTTKGFHGKGCIEESQFIKDALGEEIISERKLTPTYYEKEGEKEKRWLPICG